MATAIADVRTAPVGLIHLSLAVGGFAIGTTEFATMSLLPDMARDLGVDAPPGTSSAPMRWGWSSAHRRSRYSARAWRGGIC